MNKQNKVVITKIIPALTARTQLGQILQRVTNRQERFIISRRGEASAVIMSVEDYLRNIVKTPEALASLQEEARRKGLDKLSMDDIDVEVAASRKGL